MGPKSQAERSRQSDRRIVGWPPQESCRPERRPGLDLSVLPHGDLGPVADPIPSWSLGIVYSVTDSDAFAPLVAVAACGPALAAITITGLLDCTGTLLAGRDFGRTFLLAWPIAAFVLFLGWTLLEDPDAPMVALAVFSFVVALPVTFVLATVRSRRPAVRQLMGSLFRVRGVGRWLIVAVVFIPGLLFFAQWTDQALGEPWLGLDLPATGWALVGLILVKFAYQLLYFNATGEEVGWRGFALPRMQARTSPLIAAIVIGILWAPWHFWLWESEGKEVWTVEFWLDMISGHILFSVLLVWMCNRAGGSILIAGVGHAATNTAFEYLTGLSGPGIQLTWLGAALLLIVSDRMWQRLPQDHPVVYRPGPPWPPDAAESSEPEPVMSVSAESRP